MPKRVPEKAVSEGAGVYQLLDSEASGKQLLAPSFQVVKASAKIVHFTSRILKDYCALIHCCFPVCLKRFTQYS